MSITPDLIANLVVMAGVTYLIRVIPFVAFRKKIQNRFIRSFLYYIPYAVLAAMTVPAIFSSTSHLYSALVGFAAALVTAFFGRGLETVALSACGAVLLAEFAGKLLG